MTTRALRVCALDSLTPDQVLAADGTIWSHAATLGTRFKGSEFTIDEATIGNFIRVFTSGYPSKIPVDYEHGTVNGATNHGQPVPKAGDVLELRGVFSAADFTGELEAAVEKLTAKAGRPLDDPKNLGLWMRWRPTRRALGMIQEREYSELSIAFDQDMPDNTTGEGQGPALYSVALTNLPFLDDMLPLAASRGAAFTPAPPGTQEKPMTQKLTLLSAVAAVLAKPVSDDEQAVTELTAFGAEVKTVREYATVVGAEVGEPDPAKAVGVVRQLRADNAAFKAKAEQEQQARIASDVEAFLTSKEQKIGSVPLRQMLSRQMAGELTAEPTKKPADTETAKTIESMPDVKALGQTVAGDAGNASQEQAIAAKAKELLANDPEIKALSVRDPNGAQLRAMSKAVSLVTAGK